MKKINYSLNVIAILVTMYLLSKLNEFVPTSYIFIGGLLIFMLLLINVIITKKVKNYVPIIVLTIFSILILGIEIYTINRVEIFKQFIENITEEKKEVDIFNLLSKEALDISEKMTVGVYFSTENLYNEAVEVLKSQSDIEIIEFDNYNDLLDGLINNEINTIFVLQSEFDIILEEREIENLNILKTIELENYVPVEEMGPIPINEPFVVYLSGIDSTSDAMTKTRSDVNMVLVVDIENNEVLMINIPRDYYVLMPSYNYYDKLTHAGIYGVNESMLAIENLLDIEIDYYLRVNFNAIVDLVDAIGGINVYSEYSFKSWNYYYNQGYNQLTGKTALEFSRYRAAFTEGDRQRGENQQAVIDAIISKVSESEVILNSYEDILTSLKGSVYTNMETEQILKLISFQLSNLESYNVNTYSLDGYDASEYISMFGSYLYVMKQNTETIEIAKEKIQEILS